MKIGRSVIGTLAALHGVSLALGQGSSDAARPNVLFILVDDLGWSDVGYNGSRVYETPHIDRLASQGTVLTDFYAAGPVCSPTRAAILTGKSPARLGITTYLITPEQDPPHVTHHLPLEETTLAEALREEGYATGLFGKWHLGYQREHWADRQGFEVAKGGEASVNAWRLGFPDREPPPGNTLETRYFSPYGMTHLGDGPPGEYLTDRLTDETIAFIERHQRIHSDHTKPFFAFLSYHTVHTPLQPKPEKTEKYRQKIESLGLTKRKEPDPREKQHQNNPAYAAMVEHMDENVGRLMDRLEALGLSERTLVIWTSDNGGKGSVTSNRPLRGMKHNLYEGGIRVPAIIRWPGHIAAGHRQSTPLIATDFFPTLLDLTGSKPLPDQHLDGMSFATLLKDPAAPFERGPLFWHYPHNRHEAAIRDGHHKLLHWFKEDRAELYDLETDIGEQHDLSDQQPELAARLLEKLKRWQRETGARFE